MSLDVSLLVTKPCEIFSANCTHNLTSMAKAAGIYEHLWRPEKMGITKAYQLIEPLKEAYDDLTCYSLKYKVFNPSNGWGSYDSFVRFVAEYLEACIIYPDAEVSVCR